MPHDSRLRTIRWQEQDASPLRLDSPSLLGGRTLDVSVVHLLRFLERSSRLFRRALKRKICRGSDSSTGCLTNRTCERTLDSVASPIIPKTELRDRIR